MTMMPIRQSNRPSVCSSLGQSVCQPVSQAVRQPVRETNLYIFTGGKMVKCVYKLGLDQGRKKKIIMI